VGRAGVTLIGAIRRVIMRFAEGTLIGAIR
jgi:hypothetical protein